MYSVRVITLMWIRLVQIATRIVEYTLEMNIITVSKHKLKAIYTLMTKPSLR